MRGVALVIVGRSREKLAETAQLVQARAGGFAEIVAGDVTDEAVRGAAIETARRRFGRVDILVNNAGNVRAGRLDKIEVSEIRALIEVDLVAPILVAREALPALRESGEAAMPRDEEAVDRDLWEILRWMVVGVGGAWTLADLEATGRLFRIPRHSDRP
jgi:uncharacterized protein